MTNVPVSRRFKILRIATLIFGLIVPMITICVIFACMMFDAGTQFLPWLWGIYFNQLWINCLHIEMLNCHWKNHVKWSISPSTLLGWSFDVQRLLICIPSIFCIFTFDEKRLEELMVIICYEMAYLIVCMVYEVVSVFFRKEIKKEIAHLNQSDAQQMETDGDPCNEEPHIIRFIV